MAGGQCHSPQNRRHGSVGTRHQPGPASKGPSGSARAGGRAGGRTHTHTQKAGRHPGKQKADGLKHPNHSAPLQQRRPHRVAGIFAECFFFLNRLKKNLLSSATKTIFIFIFLSFLQVSWRPDFLLALCSQRTCNKNTGFHFI